MTDGIMLPVRLTPKASREAIQGWMDGTAGQKLLKISVTAVPEDGKANKALVNLLARVLDIPASRITIARGETSRNKLLKINGISADDLQSLGSRQP